MPIPYARAVEVVHNGRRRYGVMCPICDHVSIGSGRTEDTITKSASRKYAEHYSKNH